MSNKKTLDTHYTSKVNDFQTSQERLAHLKSILKDVDCSSSNYNRIKNEINELENKCEEEIDYYMNTGSILFDYYNIVENNVDETLVNNTKDNSKGILKFFVKNDQSELLRTNSSNCTVEPEKRSKDRATLLEKYISFTSSNYFKNVEDPEESVCVHCGSSNRVVMVADGIICCNDCQNIEYIIVDHDKPSYKEAPREITYYSYRRLNHLNELHITTICATLLWMNICFAQKN